MADSQQQSQQQSQGQQQRHDDRQSQQSQQTRSIQSAQGRAAELVTEQGRTVIADTVVAKIAARSAREVAGIHDLVSGGVGGALTGLTQRVTGGETGGVNVEVGQREAAVDLAMTVDYGVSIPQVADAVRHNIMNRVQSMTGLRVREVNIDVTDLYFPDQQQDQQQSRVQ